MIDYIRGTLAELNATNVVVEAHGVGYDLNITLIDYGAMLGSREAQLYVHESIREDAYVLYGFLNRHTRELFRLLIGVSGVGPNTARLILSAMHDSELEQAIASGDDRMLKSVKGIGGRTAQRIIVDLKDKIKVEALALTESAPVGNETYDDSLAALVMLGYTAQQSQKALKKIFADDPSASTEKAIKQALKML
ncbi:MAG: Holliday junction branch migration protein RuvA [Muribaculaceae bacterium]|nr:Holliday junction branch migration protein RuvA [Muribaculaceae bacterium]MDE6803772.1 Holliday junction branch migration protein RuvA [Muribaculaceae bacterium]MDE7188863.1 Holliday junction branch migration protein RuvA [Muribaculaceae bacterium]